MKNHLRQKYPNNKNKKRDQKNDDSVFEVQFVSNAHIPGTISNTDSPFEGLKQPVENQIPRQRGRRRSHACEKGITRVIAQKRKNDRGENNGENFEDYRVSNSACQR